MLAVRNALSASGRREHYLGTARDDLRG